MVYGVALVPDSTIHLIPSERSERGKKYVAH